MAEEGHKRVVSEYVADLKEKGVKSWTASSYGEELNGVFCLLNAGYCPDVDLLSRDRKRLERDVESLLGNLRFLKEYGGDATRLRDLLTRWIDFRAPSAADDALLARGTRYSMDDLRFLFVVYVLKRRTVAFDTAKNYLREIQSCEVEAQSVGLSPMIFADASPARVEAAFDKLNARKPFVGIAATSVAAWKEMLAALRSGEPFAPRELPFDTLISRFQEYLTDKTSVVVSTVAVYVGVMKKIRFLVCETQDPTLCRLLFSTDRILVKKTLEKLKQLKAFSRFNEKRRGQPSSVLNKWVEFIADLERSAESVAPSIPVESAPVESAPVEASAPCVSVPPASASVSVGHTLDWDNTAEAVWGKPLSVSYMGGEETNCKLWRDVYGHIFQKLFELYPNQMNQFVDKLLPLSKSRFPYLLSYEGRFNVPIEIKKNVWANGNLSVKIFMRNVKETMGCLNVPYSSFTVHYLKRGEVLEAPQPNLFDNVEESGGAEGSLTESLANDENLTDEDSITLDWTNPGEMTNTAPTVVYYNDMPFRFSNWSRVYSFVIKELSSHRNGSYNLLIDNDVKASSHNSCKIQSLCFDENRWLNFDCPVNLVVKKLKTVLEVQRLLHNSPFEIRYRRLPTGDGDNRSNNVELSLLHEDAEIFHDTVQISPRVEEIIRQLLVDAPISFDEYGFKRFSQRYEETAGEPLPGNCNVETLVSRVGVEYEKEGSRKICGVSLDANHVVAEIIKEAEERDNRALYYQKMFDDNYARLSRVNIVSWEVLRGFIEKYSLGEVFKKDYFALTLNDSPEEDVVRFLQGAGAGCAYFDVIFKTLPYLNKEDVLPKLRNDDRFVSAGKGRIALSDYFEIHQEDVEESRRIVKREIEERGFSSLKSLDVSRSIEMWGADMDSALREILYQNFLSESYDKKNSVISRQGEKANVKNALADYCQKIDTCNLDMLKDYEREYFGTDTRSLEIACQEMIRLDSERFCRLDSLNFPTEKIDAMIESCVGASGAISVKELISLAVFPVVDGASWNGFLLESYVRHKSVRFSLSSLGKGRVGKKSPEGVVVPKNKDFASYEDMFAHVLASEIFSAFDISAVRSRLEEHGFNIKGVDLYEVIRRVNDLRCSES